MLFEFVDISLHRLMKWSYKKYRNFAKRKLCDTSHTISSFDMWYADFLYQRYVLAKRLYNGHIYKPSDEHSRFLVAMDEIFSHTKILKVLWPSLKVREFFCD